jgi:hypothetical protein
MLHLIAWIALFVAVSCKSASVSGYSHCWCALSRHGTLACSNQKQRHACGWPLLAGGWCQRGGCKQIWATGWRWEEGKWGVARRHAKDHSGTTQPASGRPRQGLPRQIQAYQGQPILPSTQKRRCLAKQITAAQRLQVLQVGGFQLGYKQKRGPSVQQNCRVQAMGQPEDQGVRFVREGMSEQGVARGKR